MCEVRRWKLRKNYARFPKLLQLGSIKRFYESRLHLAVLWFSSKLCVWVRPETEVLPDSLVILGNLCNYSDFWNHAKCCSHTSWSRRLLSSIPSIIRQTSLPCLASFCSRIRISNPQNCTCHFHHAKPKRQPESHLQFFCWCADFYEFINFFIELRDV